jgi:hypothetical protein
MKIRPVAIYFVIPALVLAWLLREDPGTASWSQVVLASVINYLLFALPQLSWLGISRFIEASPVVKHAGFLGATLPLVGLIVAFECCIDNSKDWAGPSTGHQP